MKHILSPKEVRDEGYYPLTTLGWEDERGDIYFQMRRPCFEGIDLGVYHLDRKNTDLIYGMDSYPWVDHAPFDGNGIVICQRRDGRTLEIDITYNIYLHGEKVGQAKTVDEITPIITPLTA